MNLGEIIPPPKNPQYNGRPDGWDLIERILEMKLPEDYKKLVNNYGTGCFLDFLDLLTPFAPFDGAFNLLSGFTCQLLRSYESGRKEFPEYSPPFRAYPHESGLFPWARTINGDTLFWLREGEPEDWSVVICDSKFSREYDHFHLNATDFLCSLMMNKIKSQVFPSDILSGGITFVPFSK